MADIAAGLDIRSTVDVALINKINPTMIIQQDGWIVTKRCRRHAHPRSRLVGMQSVQRTFQH